jgi:hypothetical protein
MVKKITIGIVWILLSGCEAFSQKPPNNLFPLTSTRRDVIKALGEGQVDGVNHVVYSLKDKDIRITYYKSGCTATNEKTLKISPDTVLEVSVIPKNQQKLFQTVISSNLYKRYDLPDGRFLYFNSRDGILVVSRNGDVSEYTEKIYFIPVEPKIPECIVNSFDDNSGLGLLNYAGIKATKNDKFIFPPVKIGLYFEQDSTLSKNEILNEFSKKLFEHKNGIGYIVMFRGQDDSPSVTLRRRNKLLVNLKKRGIVCNKLLLVDGGVGGLPSVSFTVVHKTFVSESKMKTLCD